MNGNVHTNGIENFWSLLKRGLNGTYVSVEPLHLFRYIDEQIFRFNNRKPMHDSERINLPCSKDRRQAVDLLRTHRQDRGKAGSNGGRTPLIPFRAG